MTRDITGQRFGYLTALRPSGRKSACRSRFWILRCDCGNEKEVDIRNLTGRQHIVSCGCMQGRRYPMNVSRSMVRRAQNHRYRAAKLEATVEPVTADQIQQRMETVGSRCAYCGSPHNLTVDHVVPLSRGGAHALTNLLPACASCNSRKQASLLSEWSPPAWGDVCLLI